MGAPGSVEGPGALEAQGFVHCPWCGEEVEIVLDPGGAAVQEYIEDCEVCCRPWQLVVRWDGHGHPSVEAGRAD
ncbi:MAG: CPXCG motif-containing cysteine-rich protein [Gemmatimonadales bacterium]|nr:MAG: CPXCG motif-containing cysteine-rich protein [Gemmatimonadales bacterium]